jgi:DNA-binding IclR family transcriptional regulator
MPADEHRAKNPVGAIYKATRVVAAIKEHEGAGITELAEKLDMTKSGVHNYLSTLEDEGFVKQNETSKQYRVGLRFLEFAEYARKQHRIYRIAQPEIRDLAEETGERAHLMIEEAGKGVIVQEEEGSQAVNIVGELGSRVPLHCTAGGKIILSYLPEARRERILDRHGLPRYTRHTITEREELHAELERVREDVGIEREEYVRGIGAIGAPILDEQDDIIAAISISGPVGRIEDDAKTDELTEIVRTTSNIIGITYMNS